MSTYRILGAFVDGLKMELRQKFKTKSDKRTVAYFVSLVEIVWLEEMRAGFPAGDTSDMFLAKAYIEHEERLVARELERLRRKYPHHAKTQTAVPQ